MVAGALVIVGVVEHRLRVEFLPELAAREGEAEGLDGLLVRHAEGVTELVDEGAETCAASADVQGLALFHEIQELVRSTRVAIHLKYLIAWHHLGVRICYIP